MNLPHNRAKPPWLPLYPFGFDARIAELSPEARDRFFVLLVHEIARRQELFRVGLLPARQAKKTDA